MTTHNDFYEYHKQNGLWDSAEKFSRHGYVLSPEKFVLTREIQKQLREIGEEVCGFQHDMLRIAHLAQKESGDHFKGMVKKILNESLGGLPFIVPKRIVPLCKVDLMLDIHGNLKIAEIDAYNPRGIAYTLFVNEMHKELGNVRKEDMLPGVYRSFGAFSGFLAGLSSPVWVYSHRERYYETILKHMEHRIICGNYDSNMHLLSAMDFKKIEKVSKDRKFFIVPWGMQQPEEQETKQLLLEKYQEDEQSFFYPLVPWMGSKGLLGLISSFSEELKNIEGRSHYCELFDVLRKYLPETLLISKRNKSELENFLKGHPNCVLKANVASGMKGVWFKEEEIQANLIKAVGQKNPAYTIQELVEQKRFTFQTFSSGGELHEGEWYVRLVIHVDDRGNVVDAVVTGRPEPQVHGASDCIMLPCVLG